MKETFDIAACSPDVGAAISAGCPGTVRDMTDRSALFDDDIPSVV
jgi:hypothetical protein